MEFFMAIGAWLVSHVDTLLQIIGGFAAVATLTPNKSDDKIVQLLLDGVNFVGGNMGKAKNS